MNPFGFIALLLWLSEIGIIYQFDQFTNLGIYACAFTILAYLKSVNDAKAKKENQDDKK